MSPGVVGRRERARRSGFLGVDHRDLGRGDVVPWFLKGTNLSVEVTAVKVNQAARSTWQFNATDQAGNKRICA